MSGSRWAPARLRVELVRFLFASRIFSSTSPPPNSRRTSADLPLVVVRELAESRRARQHRIAPAVVGIPGMPPPGRAGMPSTFERGEQPLLVAVLLPRSIISWVSADDRRGNQVRRC